MDTNQIQVYAGVISSVIFIFSNLPMVFKALKTRDLKSYSLGYLALSNLGNLIHWVYISSLPVGPIWFLHGFFTLVTGLMLICYLRFELPEISIFRAIRPKPNLICDCGCANACLANVS